MSLFPPKKKVTPKQHIVTVSILLLDGTTCEVELGFDGNADGEAKAIKAFKDFTTVDLDKVRST